jgi:succinate-acetate transporter protein
MFLICTLGLHARHVGTPNILVGVMIFFGGICQFLAGIMEFMTGNTVSKTFRFSSSSWSVRLVV